MPCYSLTVAAYETRCKTYIRASVQGTHRKHQENIKKWWGQVSAVSLCPTRCENCKKQKEI